jgi:hypothetical protein
MRRRNSKFRRRTFFSVEMSSPAEDVGGGEACAWRVLESKAQGIPKIWNKNSEIQFNGRSKPARDSQTSLIKLKACSALSVAPQGWVGWNDDCLIDGQCVTGMTSVWEKALRAGRVDG